MNKIKFPSKEVPQWQIDKWIIDIRFSDMKNHVEAKKMEEACHQVLKNWPKGLEKNANTLRSQAYQIITRGLAHTVLDMPEYAPQDIDEQYATDWRDR